MDKVQSHDDETQGSGSGSGLSDLSALENETDDFGRRLLQHQRDIQRLNNALRSDHPAFRKARPSAPLVQQLELKDVRAEIIAAREHERTGSGGSADSDPPLNIPRQWGRKSRTRGDWFRDIYPPEKPEVPVVDGEHDGDVEKMDADAIIPHRTAYTGDEDWTNNADEPLPSIETTPPTMRQRRLSSSPTSLRHMNSTFKGLSELEEQDFTAASLLASTPAVSRRTRKIDELTRREIETVERRGVTKRTLGQIFEQSANQVAADTRPATAPVTEMDRLSWRRRSLTSNKENVQPNGEVNGGLKGTQAADLGNRTTQAVTFKNAQRPVHRRNDSMNLLKQLARVSSMSPSPAKDKSEIDVPKTRARSEPVMDSAALSLESASSDFPASVKSSQTSKEQRHVAEVAEHHTDQADNGFRDGASGDDVKKETPDIDVTPAPLELGQNIKTPVVTGAWTETPGLTVDVRPLLNTTDSTIVRAFGSASGNAALEHPSDPLEEGVRRIASKPVQASSALADILREARTQPNVEYGDATINSLEDVVNPNLDCTDPTITADISEMSQELADQINGSEPLTQAEKDRRQERLAIEAMNKHLRAARTSIKDADRGLRRVENRIETAQRNPPTASSASPISSRPNPIVGRLGRTPCEVCGGTYYGSVWHALWVEFRSCFYTSDTTSAYRIRFTWLGLLCTISIVWYITESTLCSYYCHPMYASWMEDYGVDPDAPMFPFVIPTLIFRPFRWVWEPALEHLAWCMEVGFNWAFGDNASAADPPVVKPADGMSVKRAAFTSTAGLGKGDWIATATSTSVRVANSVVDAVDEIGSFWDDEVLL